MPFISPLQGVTPRSILDRIRASLSSDTPPSSSPPIPELEAPRSKAVSSVNEELALNGCYRCGHISVCATHAKDHDLFPGDENEELISLPETHPRSIIADYEQKKYVSNQPRLALEKEEKRAKWKAWVDRTKMGVEDDPFCCGDLKIIERESTMRATDPDYPRLKTLVDSVKDPQRVFMDLDVVPPHKLNTFDTVYKVNVYGRHVPFDAHSTWLFGKEPDDGDLDGPLFFGFMYCEKSQPFSSVKKYVAVSCMGEHNGFRRYRIGVYDSDWIRKGGLRLGGTFGDKNLDKVLRMPGRKSAKLGETNLYGSFQQMVREQEIIENALQ